MFDVKHNKAALTLILIAAIGGILYGYDIGIIAGALLFIERDIAMSPQQMSFLVAAVLGGGAFATLVTGPLSDWLGRRFMLLSSSIIFLIGVFSVAFAHSYTVLLLGRITQGIGVGIITIAVPLYMAESVPSHLRGRGISAFQMMLTVGILLASLVDLYFTTKGSWRGMFLSAAIPGLIMLVGASSLQDSPRWLTMKGHHEKALSVLKKTRPDHVAHAEWEQIKQSLSNYKNHLTGTKQSLFQKRYAVPLVIVFAVAILGQLTGINSILQFSAVILKQAGLESNISAMLGSTAITGLNFLVTVIALGLIDKVGRKALLSIGTCGVVCALTYSALVFGFAAPGPMKGYLLLVGVLGFIFFFAIGPGVVVWLILSELLPSRIRSTGMAVALFLNSLTSTLLASVFLDLVSWVGYIGVFGLCAACSFIYFLLAIFIIPETKNKTLEEIEHYFSK
ncbi:MAG: sugar transporter [Gammaproteobacteria bacterium]|jgi:sugar porter (SP) family MFS transporter|nr:sugar transporter [Gammaproteobacteria bacterium]